MNTRPIFAATAGLLALIVAQGMPAWAQKGVPATTVLVGGHPMASDHDIIDNLSQSPEHTVFLGLLRQAGLADTLQGHGPFTVFAPTNSAFAALAPGILDGMRRPEGKAALVTLLSQQIVPGNFSLARLHYLLRTSKGPTDVDTLNDGKVTVASNGPANLMVRGPKGDAADIVVYDVKQSNGVLLITDRVLQPG